MLSFPFSDSLTSEPESSPSLSDRLASCPLSKSSSFDSIPSSFDSISCSATKKKYLVKCANKREINYTAMT